MRISARDARSRIMHREHLVCGGMIKIYIFFTMAEVSSVMEGVYTAPNRGLIFFNRFR